MKKHPADITKFLVLILADLEAAGVEYLIAGAITERVWGSRAPHKIWILL